MKITSPETEAKETVQYELRSNIFHTSGLLKLLYSHCIVSVRYHYVGALRTASLAVTSQAVNCFRHLQPPQQTR